MLTTLLAEYFNDVSVAITWANLLVGNYLPTSDNWLVDKILHFQWVHFSDASGTLIILVKCIEA